MQDIKTLTDAIRYFSDEQACIDAVAAMRWPNGEPVCPQCAGTRVHWLDKQKRWKCKNGKCKKQFSVKVGTIFEDSPIKLDKWLTAMWLMSNCKNGISSYEIARSVGVTQKSAWFMTHRIRKALAGEDMPKIGGGSKNPVEVDETWIGGKPNNMHRGKRLAMGQNGNKTIVMGMLARGSREVRTKVVPNVKRDTLQAEILKNVGFAAHIHTDCHVGYDGLNATKIYVHETVNHMMRYVDGKVHTNGIENFWSLLKRGLNGTYVAVEPFHLERYVDEQAFRYNNRIGMNDRQRFEKALSQISGKRVTYAELTGKVGETPSRESKSN